MFAQRIGGLDILVGGEVVTDHDGARLDFGDKNLADVSGEGLPIHNTLDNPRCDEAVMCQTGDERLGAPCPEGRAHVQAFSARTSAALAGHVGFYGSFINKDDLLGLPGNGWKPPAEPGMSGTSHMGFSTFIRDEALFLYVNPNRRSRSSMPDVDDVTPWASRRAACSSRNVMSGSCSTSSAKNPS